MSGPSDTPRPDHYLTVGTAADLLGVSIETLRRWDRAGKFRPARHPINGYRLYDREQILTLLGQLRPPGRTHADPGEAP